MKLLEALMIVCYLAYVGELMEKLFEVVTNRTYDQLPTLEPKPPSMTAAMEKEDRGAAIERYHFKQRFLKT